MGGGGGGSIGPSEHEGWEAELHLAAEAGRTRPPPRPDAPHSPKDGEVARANVPLPQLLKWFWSRKGDTLLLARKCHFTSCLPFLSVQLESGRYL